MSVFAFLESDRPDGSGAGDPYGDASIVPIPAPGERSATDAIVGDRGRQVSEMSERQHLAWAKLPERKQ